MIKTILLLATLFSGLFSAPEITLRIEIKDLNNNKGHLLLELLDENKISIKGGSQKIENKRSLVTIKNLPPGKYVFKYFHDENDNKELDTNWMGIPKEGYGFSNNARGKFGPPTHKKMIFELTSDTTMVCSPHYSR